MRRVLSVAVVVGFICGLVTEATATDPPTLPGCSWACMHGCYSPSEPDTGACIARCCSGMVWIPMEPVDLETALQRNELASLTMANARFGYSEDAQVRVYWDAGRTRWVMSASMEGQQIVFSGTRAEPLAEEMPLTWGRVKSSYR